MNRGMHSSNLLMTDSRLLRNIDRLERALILALYSWFVVRIVRNYVETGNVGNLILLACEGLIFIFILIRRRTSEISVRPSHWLLAFCGTVVPLFVEPVSGRALLPPVIGALVMLSGLTFQMYGKLALGRRFGCVPAHRGLILSGPYRYVRHPIYAGYFISHVGFACMNPSLWNLGVYGLAYVMQVPRLLAEERLLSRDPDYQKYMANVRYRLVPGLY